MRNIKEKKEKERCDGPSQQYRNKNMFHLIATYLQQELQCQSIRWHFTEKGHGKGAPDGIGGAIKRTADNLVSNGVDIPNIECLFKQLGEKNSNIIIFQIPKESFKTFEEYIPQGLKTFKGTLKAHEVTWAKKTKDTIQVRRLSCKYCKPSEMCPHYTIGTIEVPIPQLHSSKEDEPQPDGNRRAPFYPNVYSDSSDGEITNTSSANVGPDELFKTNDYVVVRVFGEKRKSFQNFVALVCGCENAKEYSVKFLKKCGKDKFILPADGDIFVVDNSDIVGQLKQPTLTNNRGQYVFHNISGYNIRE